MKIQTAEFLIGAASGAQFPSPVLPEVAFAGKSNVGKSSLINFLLNRKNLVKISGVPGKTRQLNFFLINGRFRLVDLPGYGFSRASHQEQANWVSLVESYLRDRPGLRGVVLILDVRHDPGPNDRMMKDWLEHFAVPYLAVANKTDKVSKGRLPERLAALAKTLGLPEKPLPCAARSRQGRGELWLRLQEWLGPRDARQALASPGRQAGPGSR